MCDWITPVLQLDIVQVVREANHDKVRPQNTGMGGAKMENDTKMQDYIQAIVRPQTISRFWVKKNKSREKKNFINKTEVYGFDKSLQFKSDPIKV